jgi:ABC-type enterochelin transport system substrate-binding protein
MISNNKNAKSSAGNRNGRKLWGPGALLVLMVFLALVFVACRSDEETKSSAATNSPVITATSDTSTDITIGADRYLPDVPRISAKELKSKLQTGANVLVIDTRSLEQFTEYRIAGAISRPVSELSRYFDEMRKYDEVAVYCT